MDSNSNYGPNRRHFTFGERLISFLSVMVLLFLFPFSILGALIYFAASWMCGHSVATPCLSVRLFSRSAQSNYDWFMEQLRGDTFKDLVKETKPFYISNSNRYEFMEEIHKCNFAVLYHTKHEGRINITNVTDSLYDEELKELFDALGKKNVIVLIDDLDSSGYGEKFQILETQPDMKNLAEEVFLFSEAEKKDPNLMEDKLQHIKFIMSSGSGEMTSPVRMEKLCTFLFSMASWLVNSITYIMSVSTWQRNLRIAMEIIKQCWICVLSVLHWKRTPIIGIFSRHSEESYMWLKDHLTHEFPIKTFYISNRGEWMHTGDFYQCTFAILYHTKNCGRVNITDVRDSLYDEELKFLSSELGKKKVIVVIDDLGDAGLEAKNMILRSQPSIRNLANELFLFSTEEKQSLLVDGPIRKKLAVMKLIFYGRLHSMSN